MECPRCHGMMVKDEVFTHQGGIEAARCVHCGNVVDTVVLSNRLNPITNIKKVFRGCHYVTRLAS